MRSCSSSALSLRSAGCGPRDITLSKARSRLDQRRFSRPNTHFAAFFEIYKNIIFSPANFAKFLQKIWQNLAKFAKNFRIFQNFEDFAKILPKFCKICSREDDFLVDLEKCCKMRPWLQKSASIQPRTSPGKSDVSWLCSWLRSTPGASRASPRSTAR